VRGFFAIPYAEAPVQDLRWAPPQLKKHALVELNATSFGPSCPQNGTLGADTSEDCLSLNIWAPSSSRLGKPAAVMVYIHGGSYTMGSGSDAQINGLDIVRDHTDVIGVTIK
jgi:carboxylesterase type B